MSPRGQVKLYFRFYRCIAESERLLPMTSNVNDAITDAVTQANVKKGGEAPAIATNPIHGTDPAFDVEAAKRQLEQLRRDTQPRG